MKISPSARFQGGEIFQPQNSWFDMKASERELMVSHIKAEAVMKFFNN